MNPPPFSRTTVPAHRRASFRAPPPVRLPAFDMRLLADLPGLSLQAQYMVEGFLAGRHRSPQKGSSVEFAEYRNYQMGDDLRRVDWRLYGRTDRLHVRQFEEETQLRIYLVMDTSGSMDFRSRGTVMRKVEFARVVIAAMALIAKRQRDAYGLAFAGLELTDFLRARTSARHWKTFLGRLECSMPGGRADLPKTLETLAELIPPRSLVVIASDFYEDLKPLESALRRLRYDHHDLIGLQVLDPQEVDFDLDDSGTFVDAESGAWLKLDATAVRKNYLERFGAHCEELDHLFYAVGGDMARLRTDRPPIEALARYLAHREQRL